MRTARRWLPPLLAALVVAVLASFLWSNRAEIARSWSLRPGVFLAVGVLTVATLWVRGVANRLHFGALGVDASTTDWFRLVTVTSFTNYLPLSAGLFAKGFFLKRVHALPYDRFAVGQTTLLVLIIATNGLAGLTLLALFFPQQLLGVVGAGFAAMLVAGLLLFLPPALRERLSGRWFPFDANVGPEARRGWPGVVASQLVLLLGAGTSLWLCFGMGESQVGLAACVIFCAASVLTRFVTIVPGALGVREFLIGGLALLTGFELRDAVVAATLTRAVEMVVVFSFGAVFTWTLSADVAAGPDASPPSG